MTQPNTVAFKVFYDTNILGNLLSFIIDDYLPFLSTCKIPGISKAEYRALYLNELQEDPDPDKQTPKSYNLTPKQAAIAVNRFRRNPKSLFVRHIPLDFRQNSPLILWAVKRGAHLSDLFLPLLLSSPTPINVKIVKVLSKLPRIQLYNLSNPRNMRLRYMLENFEIPDKDSLQGQMLLTLFDNGYSPCAILFSAFRQAMVRMNPSLAESHVAKTLISPNKQLKLEIIVQLKDIYEIRYRVVGPTRTVELSDLFPDELHHRAVTPGDTRGYEEVRWITSAPATLLFSTMLENNRTVSESVLVDPMATPVVLESLG